MNMGMARPVFLRRLRNELAAVETDLGLNVPDVPDDLEFPFEFEVEVGPVPGYSSRGIECKMHRFVISIGDDYPYERPRVRWLSDIFHPNIMHPSEGGSVCVMQLDHWDFDSDLAGFIRAVTELINNPNPYDPLRTPTCSEAAGWFLENT